MREELSLLVSVVMCSLLGTAALAQTKVVPKNPPAPVQKSKQQAPAAKAKPEAAPAAGQLAMPNAEKIVLLLRNTLIGLNDALQTGNFTVLRDKAAPGFRDANSAAKLGQIFSNLASSGIDLSTVSVATPQLSANPVLDQQRGMLQLKGFFPLQPTPVAFEVLYQSVEGRWRLFGISVQPATPSPQAATKMPAPPPDQN